MVEISKFLITYSKVGNSTCSDLIHPWCENCFKASIDMIKACSVGSLKFFASVYCVYFVSNNNNLVEGSVLITKFKFL